MLNRLAARNTFVVLLSGDVHFTFAAAADLYATKPWGTTAPVQPDRAARIVQLTSSPMKNADFKTKFVGLVGWSILTNPASWAGLGVPTPPDPGIWGTDVVFEHAAVGFRHGSDRPHRARVEPRLPRPQA